MGLVRRRGAIECLRRQPISEANRSDVRPRQIAVSTLNYFLRGEGAAGAKDAGAGAIEGFAESTAGAPDMILRDD